MQNQNIPVYTNEEITIARQIQENIHKEWKEYVFNNKITNQDYYKERLKFYQNYLNTLTNMINIKDISIPEKSYNLIKNAITQMEIDTNKRNNTNGYTQTTIN